MAFACSPQRRAMWLRMSVTTESHAGASEELAIQTSEDSPLLSSLGMATGDGREARPLSLQGDEVWLPFLLRPIDSVRWVRGDRAALDTVLDEVAALPDIGSWVSFAQTWPEVELLVDRVHVCRLMRTSRLHGHGSPVGASDAMSRGLYCYTYDRIATGNVTLASVLPSWAAWPVLHLCSANWMLINPGAENALAVPADRILHLARRSLKPGNGQVSWLSELPRELSARLLRAVI